MAKLVYSKTVVNRWLLILISWTHFCCILRHHIWRFKKIKMKWAESQALTIKFARFAMDLYVNPVWTYVLTTYDILTCFQSWSFNLTYFWIIFGFGFIKIFSFIFCLKILSYNKIHFIFFAKLNGEFDHIHSFALMIFFGNFIWSNSNTNAN